jgi:ankyrin repeat protein
MGMTPLMWAVYKGKRSTVVCLVEKGADVQLKSNDGYTALMLADFMNSPTIVQLSREGEVCCNASQQ